MTTDTTEAPVRKSGWCATPGHCEGCHRRPLIAARCSCECHGRRL